MRHFLAGRHYHALGNRGLRRHLVMVTVAIPQRRGVTLRYDVVERHWTARRAQRRARLLNARNGRAH